MRVTINPVSIKSGPVQPQEFGGGRRPVVKLVLAEPRAEWTHELGLPSAPDGTLGPVLLVLETDSAFVVSAELDRVPRTPGDRQPGEEGGGRYRVCLHWLLAPITGFRPARTVHVEAEVAACSRRLAPPSVPRVMSIDEQAGGPFEGDLHRAAPPPGAQATEQLGEAVGGVKAPAATRSKRPTGTREPRHGEGAWLHALARESVEEPTLERTPRDVRKFRDQVAGQDRT